MIPDQSNCIREGWLGLSVPGRSLHWRLTIGQFMSQQSYQGEQSQQGWCRSLNCQVGPLSLCFQTQMSTSFLKSYFESPAHDEPIQNLNRVGCLVCSKESGGFKLTQGIANQHPTNGQGVIAGRVPQGRAGHVLNQPLPTTIPSNVLFDP